MATWTLGLNVKGPTGTSVRVGSGSPASSLGNIGDIYIDTAASPGPNLYPAKTSSGWSSSFTSLAGTAGTAGKAGTQILSGTTQPGPPTYAGLAIGDLFLRTDTFNLYQFQTSTGGSVGLFLLCNLQGAAGAAGTNGTNGVNGTNGLSVLSGSGAPASSLGVSGQPAYIDTTAGALYGARGASAWPSTPLSLVGPQGLSILSGSGAPANTLGVTGQPAYLDTTNAVLYGAKGASAWPTGTVSLNGKSIRNGTGAPTSSNPSIQFDGDFYVDTQNNLIYGPRASGSWPASGVGFAGSTVRSGSGAPASALGAVGDVYIDLAANFFYPPKTSNGWTTAAFSLVGPPSPSTQAQPTLGSSASGTGPAAYANPIDSSAGNALMNIAPGFAVPTMFVPGQNSALMNAYFINTTNSSAAVTFNLYDQTAGTVIYTSPSCAKGSITPTALFSTTQYPLTAGNTHVWRVSGAATTYAYVIPMYLYPSQTTICVASQPTAGATNLALSTTAQYLLIPGSTILTYYQASPKAMYMNDATFYVTGASGVSVNFILYSGNTAVYTSPAVTPANSPLKVGPLGVNGATIPVNAQVTWRVTGSGTATNLAVQWTGLQ